MLCLRFFDAGQCVRLDLGDVARVNKSDKVEAAGCMRRVMGKARSSVSDIGLSFAEFAKSVQYAGLTLVRSCDRLRVLRCWFSYPQDPRIAWSQNPFVADMLGVGSEGGQEMSVSSCGLLSGRCSGSGFLSAPESLDDAHLPAAIRAWLAQYEGWHRLS